MTELDSPANNVTEAASVFSPVFKKPINAYKPKSISMEEQLTTAKQISSSTSYSDDDDSTNEKTLPPSPATFSASNISQKKSSKVVSESQKNLSPEKEPLSVKKNQVKTEFEERVINEESQYYSNSEALNQMCLLRLMMERIGQEELASAQRIKNMVKY